MVELLLEFACSAMAPEHTTKALTRMETLHAVTYEDFQRAKKVLAERKAAASCSGSKPLRPQPLCGSGPLV
ncbi:hypothetical protein [Streptomyces achromogenes]|uniref:hypothetical protein n=1 Tax=Streptomyces achromogenes TaxID=67255 RepID=UPI0036B4BEDA